MSNFKLYHVDMNEFPAHTAELDRQVVIANGYQRPRFVDTGRKVGGYLGIDDWGHYYQKPTYNALVAGGSLDASKFYSIKVVPMDTEQAYLAGPLVGPLTMPSIPRTPTEASSTIRWNIPEHSQWESHECGSATAAGSGTATDSTKEWTVDQWAGYYVWNPATDQRVAISANTATELTAAGFEIADEAYFVIQKKTVKRRIIYAAEMDDPANLLASTFHYQGVVEGAEATTWDMVDFAMSVVVPEDDIISPPKAFVAHESGGRLLLGGGITDKQGTAYVNVSESERQATAEADEAITIERTSALRDPVAARLETNRLRFTAQADGTAGNDISVAMLNTGAAALSVAVATNDISVTLNTDEGTKASAIWGAIDGARVSVTVDEAGVAGNDKVLSFEYQTTVDAHMYAVIDGDILRVYLGNHADGAYFDDAKNTRELIVLAINGIVDSPFTAVEAGVAGSIATNGQVQFRGGINPLVTSTAAEVKSAIEGTPAAHALVAVEVREAGTVSALAATNLAGGLDSDSVDVGSDEEIFGRFMRYTLGTALADLPDTTVVGSRLKVVNATNALNDIADAVIARVDADLRWVEVRNDEGVDAAADVAALLTVTANIVVGTGTRFSEAMQGGTILFGDDSNRYVIQSVDVIGQRMGLLTKYIGSVTNVASPGEFEIKTFSDLYYSDVGNPHTFRSPNYARFPENIVAMADYQQSLFVFCEKNIYVMNVEEPAAVPSRVTESQLNVSAPWSIASSPTFGVLFWDGTGFSVTDGVRVVSVTKDTCQWLMDDVNRAMEWNIRSLWNNAAQRWEVHFPYGGDATNNYGLYITGSDRRVYGIQMADVNALWVAPNADDDPVVRHGSSSRHSGVYGGILWDHSFDAATDGLPSDSGFLLRITAHNAGTRTLTVFSDVAVTALPGTPILLWPQGSPSAYYKNFIIESITQDTGAETDYVYDIVYSADWDMASARMGDYLLVGGIILDYGIKWSNFGSPMYRHNIRRLEIDAEPFTGFCIVDHYSNNDEGTPIYTSSHIVVGNTHKILSSPKKGAHYTHGFRVRFVAPSKVRIDNMTTLFDPVV